MFFQSHSHVWEEQSLLSLYLAPAAMPGTYRALDWGGVWEKSFSTHTHIPTGHISTGHISHESIIMPMHTDRDRSHRHTHFRLLRTFNDYLFPNLNCKLLYCSLLYCRILIYFHAYLWWFNDRVQFNIYFNTLKCCGCAIFRCH